MWYNGLVYFHMMMIRFLHMSLHMLSLPTYLLSILATIGLRWVRLDFLGNVGGELDLC